MIVKEINYKIICLEYKQQVSDSDYGSCLYARFYFNLDKYELTIISDCGNYGYKWVETPGAETFLQLMSRCSGGYIKDKIYGSPKIFDYEATKQYMYSFYRDDGESIDKLKDIFKILDLSYPESSEEFLYLFEKENDGYFDDIYGFMIYAYPSDVNKICEVFDNHIQPKIIDMINEELYK